MERTEPLNYLRQALPFLVDHVAPAFRADGKPKAADALIELASECRKAVKFVLPVGGKVLDGTAFKGLPETLKLPYQEIVIEYQALADSKGVVEDIFGEDASIPAPKRIVYAQEYEGYIDVVSIIYIRGIWTIAPYILSLWHQDGPITTRHLSEYTSGNYQPINGVVSTVFPFADLHLPLTKEEFYKHGMADMLDEGNAVLSLIEALACKNVEHEALPARKLNKSAKKGGALPFDEYRILTVRQSSSSQSSIGGSHRSPREHLRRGHIRRLETGNIWVNSCLVNAGIGGRVEKSYDMRKAA